MTPRDLVAASLRQAKSAPMRPRKTDLRRAISSAYYALFHCLAREVADRFAGTSRNRSERAWRQAYRSLDHGFARRACKAARSKGFPRPLIRFADAFILLQEERHGADYDPHFVITKAHTINLIRTAELALAAFRSSNVHDRAAFCVWVTAKDRR